MKINRNNEVLILLTKFCKFSSGNISFYKARSFVFIFLYLGNGFPQHPLIFSPSGKVIYSLRKCDILLRNAIFASQVEVSLRD